MGSNTGSSSGGGSASKAGMSKKSAETNPVVQGIRADQYARKKLGITPKVANPNQPLSQANISGYYSTKISDQMYGSEYQAARGEYLESKGLATARTITDDFGNTYTTYDPAIKRDGKLVYTNESRGAMEAAKRESIPLSRQMYDRQKLISSTAFAVMGALVGMPTLGITGANYIYNKPYSSTVTLGRTSATYSNQTPTSNDRNGTEQVVADQTNTAVTTNKTTQDDGYVARVASLTSSGGGEERKFFTGTRKTIKGSLKGFV